MDLPNNTAMLLSLVCHMYGWHRQARTLAMLANTERYRAMLFDQDTVLATLTACGVPAIGLILTDSTVPLSIQATADDGQAVLLELKPSTLMHGVQWALLDRQSRTHCSLITIGTDEDPIVHPQPVSHYATGRFVVCAGQTTLSAVEAYKSARDR